MSAYLRRSVLLRRSQRAGLAGLAFLGLCSSVSAADKPPLAPDTAVPLATQSHVSATVEFGLPALAAEIEKDIPRRLATIDERVNCVHRRVLFFGSAPIAMSGVLSSDQARFLFRVAAIISMAPCRSMA
jgi:hypothetical protein